MLMKYKTGGVSVLVVLDRRRQKKNGLYPVKIEVVFRGVQKYYPTGQDLSIDCWQTLGTKRRHPPESYFDIQDSFDHIKNEVKTLVSRGVFSISALDTALGLKENDSLQQLLGRKMNTAYENGRINSYYRYRSSLRALNRFVKTPVPLRSVTPLWLKTYQQFLQNEGKSGTTVNIYLSAVKAVVSESIRLGMLRQENNPFCFGKYMVPPSASRHIALSDSQIARLIAYRGTETEEKYRDLWLFSYLCNGINFRDMLFLKYGNISGGEIYFTRSKTSMSGKMQRVVRSVLTTRMERIIVRWGNPYTGNPDTYIFRYAHGGESEQEKINLVRRVDYLCNRTLRHIAAKLGIPRLTVYSARHSFATVLQRKGIDVSLISECLGHSSLTTTRNYLSGPDEKTRRKMAELLTRTGE